MTIDALHQQPYLYYHHIVFLFSRVCCFLHSCSAPLTQDHEVYTTVQEVGFFTSLRDKTGTLPETLCSLRDKPFSLRVRAEIFWLFKNFHELHMKFDLEIHRVNFMLT